MQALQSVAPVHFAAVGAEATAGTTGDKACATALEAQKLKRTSTDVISRLFFITVSVNLVVKKVPADPVGATQYGF